jgi:hypothetical protein
MDTDPALIKDFNFEPELISATPFWLAARFTEPEIMRLLVKPGADPRFDHHSDRSGPRAYQHRLETLTAVMAASGMGGGGSPWVEVDRSANPSLLKQ